MVQKTSIPVRPYPGEEDIIMKNSGLFSVQVTEPEFLMIVLGASNKPENELHLDAVLKDKMPVYKRKGGGGAVLLGPGMVIITLKGTVKSLFDNKRYFDLIQYIIQSTIFKKIGIEVESKGISDLAIYSKKVLGSSIYRCKQTLLYQGVLLVEADLNRIGTYIKYPKREPDYRNKRKHDDFVANITQYYPFWRTKQVIQDFRQAFEKSFYYWAMGEFITEEQS